MKIPFSHMPVNKLSQMNEAVFAALYEQAAHLKVACEDNKVPYCGPILGANHIRSLGMVYEDYIQNHDRVQTRIKFGGDRAEEFDGVSVSMETRIQDTDVPDIVEGHILFRVCLQGDVITDMEEMAHVSQSIQAAHTILTPLSSMVIQGPENIPTLRNLMDVVTYTRQVQNGGVYSMHTDVYKTEVDQASSKVNFTNLRGELVTSLSFVDYLEETGRGHIRKFGGPIPPEAVLKAAQHMTHIRYRSHGRPFLWSVYNPWDENAPMLCYPTGETIQYSHPAYAEYAKAPYTIWAPDHLYTMSGK